MDSRLTGLYVVTDAELRPGRSHAEIASAAIRGGARIVQFRDKNATDRDYFRAAMELRRITSEANAMLFINDRVDIAAAVKADGINLGQTDLPVHAARRILGHHVIIGVSADTIDQARRAEMDGANYVGFGPVFPTSTKLDAGPVSGLDTFRQVCRLVDIPVVAIGGICIDNIASVAQAGARCAAVVSAVVCADDPGDATARLIEAFRT